MEAFFRTHRYLVEHINAPVRRLLMDEIDWSDRLIGIKGTRGVGKTTFLLQYAKENFPADTRRCLYVNMNNFYFQDRGIVDFAGDFVRQGGGVLLIDQVFKYPDWSQELRRCHDIYPQLKIVFTGSSVMRLKEENTEIGSITHSYNLRGFSFREFLNLKAGKAIRAYRLEDILQNHEDIASDILKEIDPDDFFHDYIHHGFYPFFLEQRNYSENLLKTMNMMTEVDILLIKQIELKYLNKIKELFYLLTQSCTKSPNVSMLATRIATSRATVMKYLKYLADARLLNVIYDEEESYPKKPVRVMLYNTNLMYAIYPMNIDRHTLAETFFVNALCKDHKISQHPHCTAFDIDGYLSFNIVDVSTDTPSTMRRALASEGYTVVAGIKRGEGKKIPLWMFGLLY